jgi:tetratricopeptide (TPR) repeat protein
MDNPLDLGQAEKLKNAGNVHMQNKEYQAAAQCYTAALKLCPAGVYSHVYYRNRAAALVSMKQFQEAIHDSESALA